MAYYKFIARLSHLSFGFLKKFTEFLDSVNTGFWLGVMSEKSLDYSDLLYYNRTRYYTEEKYNSSGLFEWEKSMIDKHFKNAKNILLIAAGGGREALALGRMGFEVDSYECNPVLIDFGNALLEKNNIAGRIKYLEMNSVPGEIKKYDGVIIGWGAYSLIRGKKSRITFIDRLHPFLKNDSPLMISFLKMGKRGRKDKIIKCVSDFFRVIRLKERTEQGDRLVPDFIHYFTGEEIKNELIQADLRLTDYYDKDYGCIIAVIR